MQEVAAGFLHTACVAAQRACGSFHAAVCMQNSILQSSTVCLRTPDTQQDMRDATPPAIFCMCRSCTLPPTQLQRKEDGAFWMHINDFARFVSTMGIAKVRKKQDPKSNPAPTPLGIKPGPAPSPPPPSPAPVTPTPSPGPHIPSPTPTPATCMSCGKCRRFVAATTTLPPNYKHGLFQCDKCHTNHRASRGVYHCIACGWDCCVACGPSVPAPSPVPVPGPVPSPSPFVACGKCRRQLSKATILPPKYRHGTFGCDRCQLDRKASHGVYHCDACEWDCCPACVTGGPAPAPAPGRPPPEAPPTGQVKCQKCSVVLFKRLNLPDAYVNGVFACDVCRARSTASKGVYHCRTCAWDCCCTCGTDLSAVPQTIPPQ